ncbi:MAG: acetylornithine carbamoyltransferase [Chitinophagaceae bacterium]
MKHFITAPDASEIDRLISAALFYKQSPRADKLLGEGKRIGMLFMNPSLRTRLSTQIAAQNLGMDAIVLNLDKDGWKMETGDGVVMNGSTVEHIKDAGPVLGSYFDIICVRSFPSLTDKEEDEKDTMIRSLIRHTGKPVISLESTTLHPLQSLADAISIREKSIPGRKPKVVLSWAPHIKPLPQCVPNSFAQWMNVLHQDVDFVITHPEGYELAPEYQGNATLVYDQQEALADADFVYVKNWSSYNDYGAMPAVQSDWQLRASSLAHAPAAHIMHCLPVRRNVELSDELLDSARSIVPLQAANRVWAAQAVIASMLKSL